MASEHLLRVRACSEVDGRRRIRAGRADVAAIVVPTRANVAVECVRSTPSDRMDGAAHIYASSPLRRCSPSVCLPRPRLAQPPRGRLVLRGRPERQHREVRGTAVNRPQAIGAVCRCWRRGVELSRIRLQRPGGLRESRVDLRCGQPSAAGKTEQLRWTIHEEANLDRRHPR